MQLFEWIALAVGGAGMTAAVLFYLQLAQLRQEKRRFEKERDQAVLGHAQAQAQLDALRTHTADAEKIREDMLNAAKASVAETSQLVSSKLLEDHKRELEASRKESAETTQQITAKLTEQVTAITGSLAAVTASNQKQDKELKTLWNTLSNPAGAGQLAEVGLENMLKNLGLEPGRDFMMQYTIVGEDNGRLRPDCVVFLPQNHVMVIDSKASSAVMKLAQAQTEEEHLLAREGFKKTMNKHLNDLTSKDYQAALRQFYKQAGRAEAINQIFSVMYVPSEAALQHIHECDNEFRGRAERAGIILACHSSMMGLLAVARTQIGEARKAEKADEIIERVQSLMDGVIGAFKHVEKVGKGIRDAAKSFDNFAGSANQFVLPRMRKLTDLSVKPTKLSDMPVRITGCEVRAGDDAMLVEAESEETVVVAKITTAA